MRPKATQASSQPTTPAVKPGNVDALHRLLCRLPLEVGEATAAALIAIVNGEMVQAVDGAPVTLSAAA